MLIEVIGVKSKVIIFGAGNAGLAAVNNLGPNEQCIAFCDNDEAKVGSQLAELPVVSPAKLTELVFDKILIASEYFERIGQQLVEQIGISPDKISVLAANQIKPFRFGDSPEGRQASETLLGALSQCLSKYQIKHHIDAGTLLGIFRDGHLIPWDDDLDIAIPAEEVNKVRDHQGDITAELESVSGYAWGISELLSNRNFGEVKAGTTRSFKISPLENGANLPLIDLFVKYIDGDNMDYVISSRGFSMASKHMNSLETIDFNGQILPIPFDTAGYLTSHYGDWQTPKQDWTLADIKSATVF